jgi:hypothetical protein
MLKNLMKNNVFFIIYQKTKVQKMDSLKNELVNYIKWKPKPYHYLQCHV